MIPAQSVTVSAPGAVQPDGVSSSETPRWLSLGLQLALILVLAWVFRIESAAFYLRILPLAVGGAILNHLLPLRFRPTMFAALGIAGVLVVFGLAAGGWMIALGLFLIGLCHLPIGFPLRVGLVALTGLGLMTLRAGEGFAPWPRVIWPVLGSMFMFRMGLYLYDLRHRRAPTDPALILGYFFMLPNVVFLLFPVIDFQTFRRTYYDRSPLEIYGEGARWILRGLTHLVLYRFIYSYALIEPAEVTSTAGITRFLISNYGLYLRVSGQFHVITGILHLYGFRLPETHRFFFLASSFSDFWRRINIYWKDFMQKMFYLPAVMRFKRHGETAALVAGTLCVLGASWLLRSYQWFWLLGRWLFSATDIIFWGILGAFLIANTLREQRRGRLRQLTATQSSASDAWQTAWQTAGMFALMCVLWGFWTSETIDGYFSLLRTATFRWQDGAAVGAALGVVAGIAFVVRRYGLNTASWQAARRWWQHPLVTAAAPLTAVWLLGEPIAAARVPETVRTIALRLRTVELNAADANRLHRGYYEEIVGLERSNGQLWEIFSRSGRNDQGRHAGLLSPLTRVRDAFGNDTYLPNLSTTFKGGRFKVNRWGMRDQEYDLVPPSGTWRIAMLGPSFALGSGVHDDETFESLLEDRLNRELTPKTGLRYEVLNFSMAGDEIFDYAATLSTPRISQFKPAAVLVVGHSLMELQSNVAGRLFTWHKKWMLKASSPHARLLRDWSRVAAIKPTDSLEEMTRKLANHRQQLLRSQLDTAAAAIRNMRAQPLLAMIPLPSQNKQSRVPELLSLADQSGFRVMDLSDLFVGCDPLSLQMSSEDTHPNAEGHRLIAERLFRELEAHPEALGAPPAKAPSPSPP